MRTADRGHPARLVIATGAFHTAESRPELDRRAAEAIIAWNSRGRRSLLLSPEVVFAA